MTHIIW